MLWQQVLERDEGAAGRAGVSFMCVGSATGASSRQVARQRGGRSGGVNTATIARLRIEHEHRGRVIHGVVAAAEIDARGGDAEATRRLHNLGRAAGQADKIAAE